MEASAEASVVASEETDSETDSATFSRSRYRHSRDCLGRFNPVGHPSFLEGVEVAGQEEEVAGQEVESDGQEGAEVVYPTPANDSPPRSDRGRRIFGAPRIVA